MKSKDFVLLDHGSIKVLNAENDKAREWVDNHIDPNAMTWGPNGTVIESRYVDDIVQAIINDGLTIRYCAGA